MNKSILHLLLFVFFSVQLGAQSPEWFRALDVINPLDEISLTTTFLDKDNDRLILAGAYLGSVDFNSDPTDAEVSTSTANSFDKFIAAYDLNAELIWKIDLVGIYNSTRNLTALNVDSKGNVIVAGYGNSLDFDPDSSSSYYFPPGNYKNGFVAKYAGSDGSLIWAKPIVASSDINIMSIALDKNDNIYFTGSFKDSIDLNSDLNSASYLVSTGGYDGFICRWDMNGNWEWDRKIYGLKDEGLISLDYSSGDLIVTGVFQFSTTFDSATNTIFNAIQGGLNYDMFIASYDTLGVFQKAKQIGGYDDQRLTTSHVSKSGEIILTGTNLGEINIGLDGDSLSAEGFVLIFDSNWDISDSVTYSSGLFPWGISKDNLGRLAIRGVFKGQIELDSYGHTIGDDPNDLNFYGFVALYDADKEVQYSQVLNNNSMYDFSRFVEFFENNVYTTGISNSTTIEMVTGSYTHELSNPQLMDFIYMLKIQYWPAGIEDIPEENIFSLYPNPSRDIINIEIDPEWKADRIQICDVTSRVISDRPYENQIDVSGLIPGTYILGLISEEGERAARVFVRE